MHAQTKDPVLREKIEERMRRVIVERHIISLEEGVKNFHKKHGRYPENLNEMVSRKTIEAIPVEPYGGYYYFDRKTKTVRSSKVRSRLKLFLPRAKKGQRDG
jgi:hypothetical protein